jgi:glycosyltransferase involved in cell wall biosynthesis
LKVAAILPAYNEQNRVRDVVRAVLRAPSIDEIVVVNDGSTDDTATVVRSIRGVRLVSLSQNRGKGGAMMAGSEATDADVLVFLDADLIGLKPEHVEALVAPVKSGRYNMAVGSFRGGRRLTDWAQKVAPNISGQRAIRRGVFEQIPNVDTRYGVEMAITRFCRHFRVPTQVVAIKGVTHPMKEEKLGLIRGMLSRAKMFSQIMRIMMDPRAPKRIRPRRIGRAVPLLLRKMAANQRRKGRTDAASYWLYRQERRWSRKRQELKRAAYRR